MAKSEIIVGLDVGTTKICAVVGELTKNGVSLLGHGVAPCDGLHKGVVVNIEATVPAIEKAVEAAERSSGYEIRSVVVGITGEHIRSLTGKGTVRIRRDQEITRADVAQAQEAAQQIDLPPGREIIHNIPRASSVDGHHGIKNPVGMFGSTLEVETHLVTAESNPVQNIYKCVEQAGLTITQVVLEPLATAEAVLHTAEKEMGVALIDIGGGTSDLALFGGGSAFYSAVIPVGGKHVTNDLSVGLRVAFTEAERIKLEHGIATEDGLDDLEAVAITPVGQPAGEEMRVPRRIIAEIIQPRMEELFELVEEEIRRAGGLELIPAGVVISGGGSRLPGTLDVASQVLGVPVRLGAPLDPAAATGALRTPEYSTGVGLVLYAARNPRGTHHADGLLDGLFGPISRWFRRLFSR